MSMLSMLLQFVLPSWGKWALRALGLLKADGETLGDVDRGALGVWGKVLVLVVIGLALLFYTQSYYALKAEMRGVKQDNLEIKGRLESIATQLTLYEDLTQQQQTQETTINTTHRQRKERLDDSVNTTLQSGQDDAATRDQLANHYNEWLQLVYQDAATGGRPTE